MEGLEDTEMPVLCQEPLQKPQYDQSLHPPLSVLISMDQLSRRAPTPALSFMGL